MITREQLESARERARGYFRTVGIVLTADESENIEVADFCLG